MSIPNALSELLREPNLLVPRKKPTGHVRIDWSHPSTKDLVSFGLADSINCVDLVSGNSVGYYGSSRPDPVASSAGLGLRFNNPSRNAEAILLPHLKGFYDGLYNVSQMVMCAFNGSGTSTDEDALIGQWSNMQGDLQNAYSRMYVRYDSANQQFEAGVHCNNTVSYESALTGGAPTTAFDDGQIHQVIHTAGTFSGGDIQRVYFDGKSVGQQTVVMPLDTVDSTYRSPEVMGGHNVTGTTNIDSPRYDLYCWAFWRRRIEAGEAAELWADPYQMLVPA